STGCSNPGETGQNRSRVAVSSEASERAGTSGPHRDSSASRAGAGTNGTGEHSAQPGEELRGTPARLQRGQNESGERGATECGAAGGTGAVADGNRVVEREDLPDQPTNRAPGTGKLPRGGAAEAGQGRRHADCADVPAHAGRPVPIPQEPRCGLLSGIATGAQK